MKFSENWLRTLVDPPLASRALGEAVTMAGVEVELIEPVAPPFDKVVVAEVIDVQKHPAADRLTVCRVNAGGAPLQIVCGAPNVRAGIRIPLAQVGARLPATTIERAKVRGVESSGMLCSARELGIADDASGLMILPANAPIGEDVRKVLDLDDQLLTIKPTPNRGDCLSVAGFAREVAAITGAALHDVDTTAVPADLPDRVEITLEDEQGCPRYCGRIVRGIDARAPSPRWLVQRLERSGLRSISAIVDVTNYVMLELGQPLHGFDLARINGGIRVRRGRRGEKLRLLNEQEIVVAADALVIADATKPLALAGVMGGLDSAVTLDTRDVLLESAFFDPAVVAGGSRALAVASDSSYRFERGVDFAATARALERATRLVLEICGGKAGPICEAKAALPARKPVRLRGARAQRLLGIEIDARQTADILRRLGLAFQANGNEFTVTPPSYRFDLEIEEDVIEEVARVHGYDRIPANPPVAAASMLPATETSVSAAALRSLLIARDYQEIVSYSFVDREWEADFCGNDDPVALANPIAAHLNVMRSSLVGSLVSCLKLNLDRQQDRVRIFEIGRAFRRHGAAYKQRTVIGGLAYGEAVPEQWGSPRRRVDFYDVKSDIESLLKMQHARFSEFQHPALHPGRAAQVTVGGGDAGWLGELHPRLIQKYDLPFAPMAFELNLEVISKKEITRFQAFSRLPQVRRDLSFEVPASVNIQAMLDALKKRSPGIVFDIALFDLYRGKGIDSDKKSVAFRILMQDTLKTLTDAEAEAAIQQLLQVLQQDFQARLRK